MNLKKKTDYKKIACKNWNHLYVNQENCELKLLMRFPYEKKVGWIYQSTFLKIFKEVIEQDSF